MSQADAMRVLERPIAFEALQLDCDAEYDTEQLKEAAVLGARSVTFDEAIPDAVFAERRGR